MKITLNPSEVRAVMQIEDRGLIGASLYLARVSQGLSIKTVVQETGFSKSMIYDYEKNRVPKKQTEEKLDKLSNVYNVRFPEYTDYYDKKLTYRELFWEVSKVYRFNENQSKLYVYMNIHHLTYEQLGILLNMTKQAVYYSLNNDYVIEDRYITILEEYLGITDINKVPGI